MYNLLKYSGSQAHGIEQKKINQKRLVVKSLFFNGPLSSAAISGMVRLSAPKVNRLLAEMKNDKIVEIQGIGLSSGGRKPVIYGLVENGFYVAGISINISRTVISLFNSRNNVILGPVFCPVKMRSDLGIFTSIKDCLLKSCTKNGLDPGKIIAAGIEMPGLINSGLGINKTYFSEIEDLNLILKNIFDFPVFFENDAKVRTFAEQNFGMAKGRENVLMLHINWGIGMGLIINNKLFSGKSGFSGEFGHLPVSENGYLCQCGKSGCLETLASASAITRMAREGIQSGKMSLISELIHNDPEKIDISTVNEAARMGDQFAISLFTEAGKWLGKGIAFLIQLFNPELIIIGGSVAEAGQFLIAPIRQSVYTFSNQDICNDTEIVFSHGGLNAGPEGAAAMAIQRLTSN